MKQVEKLSQQVDLDQPLDFTQLKPEIRELLLLTKKIKKDQQHDGSMYPGVTRFVYSIKGSDEPKQHTTHFDNAKKPLERNQLIDMIAEALRPKPKPKPVVEKTKVVEDDDEDIFGDAGRDYELHIDEQKRKREESESEDDMLPVIERRVDDAYMDDIGMEYQSDDEPDNRKQKQSQQFDREAQQLSKLYKQKYGDELSFKPEKGSEKRADRKPGKIKEKTTDRKSRDNKKSKK